MRRSTGKAMLDSAEYDGDGQLAKESSTSAPGASETSYIVRSSVLNGEVLTRLDASGNKKITHVPAEGLLFATQKTISGIGSFVLTTYRNPLGTTETNKAVYDPLGNYIPYQAWADPRPPAGSYNSGSMGQLSSSQANPDSYGMGCFMGGMPTSCNRVLHAIARDQAKKVSIHGLALSPGIITLMASFIPITYTRTIRLEGDGHISTTITPGGEPGHFEGGFFTTMPRWYSRVLY